MPLSGRRLLHYDVVEPIAEGGTGDVYKALDTRMDRFVALRILRPEEAADPDRTRRFEHDARTAAALNHPNIATIHDITSEGPFHFVVMEYLEGYTPLGSLSGERFSSSDALRYAIPIADAMAAAHRAGIVHGGLMPSNIMLADQGRVKVLDFGMAAIAAAASAMAVTATSTARLTSDDPPLAGWGPYLSPEHVSGQPIDQRSDVFALGAILYEMLTGNRPFAGASPTTAIADDGVRPMRDLAGVPPALGAIVVQCLRRDSHERFASAAELLGALETCRAELERAPKTPETSRERARRLRPAFLLTVLAVLAVGTLYGARAYRRHTASRWAETTGLAEVIELAGAGRISAAFAVATRVESLLPSNTELRQLWPAIAREITIDTVPQGAEVFRKPFDTPDGPWEPLGRTPLVKARVPRELGRWRIEKAGFVTIEGSLSNAAAGEGPDRVRIALDRLEDAPPGMVRVAGGSDARLDLLGHDGLPGRAVPDFWIDRHEVTNRQFKLFIDAGGYQQRELWARPIVKAGTALSWEETASQFRDMTGRAGPSGWAQGAFPAGKAEHPVAGVSWYEASAYCAWVGKSLPTVWHWSSAAGLRTSASVVPASNFGGPGSAPAGHFAGLGPWGTSDMAGNVKEWCLNPTASDQRYVLGGAWGEPAAAFQQADTKEPLARLANVGFRCVKYMSDAEPGPAAGVLSISSRDYAVERPCSDDLFRFFKSLYAYERTPLNARVDRVEDTGGFRTERISFDAANHTGRVIAYLFLPASTNAPLQTVVFLPGDGMFQAASPAAAVPEFLLKSGRAVLIPVLTGTFDPRDGPVSDVPNATPGYRDRMIAWGRDLRRSVDYLQTRPEVDMRRLAYYGTGLGARVGPIMSVVEDRFKANVWAHAGLKPQPSLPEADAFHFAPRVRIPTLLLGGRYDFEYPVELSQVPLFRALGVAPDQKRHVVFETGTVPPRARIELTLEWLDRYLGPVR